MRIVHFSAGLEESNGMANVARRFAAEDVAAGHDARVTNDPDAIAADVDKVFVHGAWLPVLWKVAKLAKAVGAELVVVPHGSYDPMRLAHHGWKKRLAAICERRMLRRADVVLATCEAERKWILAYVGGEGIRDQGSGIRVEITDLKRFFRLDGLMSKSEVEQRNLHVLYLGRRHPLKGVEYLERAVGEIQSKSGAEVEQRKVELRIVRDHFGEELEKDWSWCDVLCLPTLSENFGLVVAEALERGKCVITTDGAPAWDPAVNSSTPTPDTYTYIRGYREGTDEERVRLLKEALERVLER